MARYKLADGTVLNPMIIPKLNTYSTSGATKISLSDIEKSGDDLLKPHLHGYLSEHDYQYPNLSYTRYNVGTKEKISGTIDFTDDLSLTYKTTYDNSGVYAEVQYVRQTSGGTTYSRWSGKIVMIANGHSNYQPPVSLIPAIYGIVPLFSIAVDSDNPNEVSAVGFYNTSSGKVSPTKQEYYLYITRISGDNNTLLKFFQNPNNAIIEQNSIPVSDEHGDFDNSSDIIELPSISSINIMSALTTKAVSAYKMTSDSINSLMSVLWSDDFYNTLVKNQQSPIDNIQKLTCYPFDVASVGDSAIIIGNNATNITGSLINAQFQEIDFGSVTISEYYGTALDYNGTDITIVLPFIGERQLSMPDIGSATISLKYRVDILTGNCVAIISAYRNRDNTELNSVIYQFSGNLANEFPLTQAVNKSLTKYQDAYYSLASGNIVGALSVAGREGANQILTGMPSMQYQRTGNLTASSGYMGVLTPYLIISRPVNVKPNGYDNYYGYPSFFTRKLSDCSGYTQIHELISDAPTGVPADDWETIKQMLKDGIIIN